MKRLFVLLLFAAFAFISCEKEKVDKVHYLSINPSGSLKSQIIPFMAGPNDGLPQQPDVLLTFKEIVKRAGNLYIYNPKGVTDENGCMQFSFPTHLRDTVNAKFRIYATDVITEEGELRPYIIEGRNIVLWEQGVQCWVNGELKLRLDTIAYISNANIEQVEKNMKAAFARGDRAECYRIMDEDIKYIPTTGKRYRELKAKGLQ